MLFYQGWHSYCKVSIEFNTQQECLRTSWGNQSMKITLKALAVAAVASASSFTFADEPTSPHSVSGNISVLSSYNLRGNTALPENDKVTLQGGLDYSHATGLYAGWWTSTLDGDDAYPDQTNPMEHNFYVGYNGTVNDELGFTVGTTYYYYYDIDTSDAN